MSSNTKTGSASKIKMESFDDLFGGSSAQEIGAEQIINAPLADLHEFKDHPLRYWTMKRWRKQRRVSDFTGYLFRELQDREQAAAMS